MNKDGHEEFCKLYCIEFCKEVQYFLVTFIDHKAFTMTKYKSILIAFSTVFKHNTGATVS